MTYSYKTISSLQLEITSYCNVACPQCPRNTFGGPVIDSLPLNSWSLQELQSFLPTKFIKQLKLIYFCGTYGDPMFNKNILDMCQWLKTVNPSIQLGIHTNGSLSKPNVYQQLAACVDFIAFGIDGLEDTNHLYRRNANWVAILANTSAFINSGGKAYWDFIVFQHNQHQVNQARELSVKMGFDQFNVKKTSRFFNKEHRLVDSLTVLDHDLKPVYKINPPSDDKYFNRNYDVIRQINLEDYARSAEISCYYLKNKEIYIGSDGYVFPCGWLHDRLYGIESANTKDRESIHKMMELSGGYKMANCFHTSLENIVDGAWFRTIQDSWTQNKLERCAMMCGNRVNLIKEQNEFISYK